MKIDSKTKKNAGFTLVELIVVLVILAILAAILVPTLLGYIDRAKNHQYIVEAQDLMKATQAGIVEAYARDKVDFKKTVRKSKCSFVTENYGYYTNNVLALAMKNDALDEKKENMQKNGAKSKNTICREVVKYADTFDYQFNADPLADNTKVSSLGDTVGFMILYNERGQIVYMQYARDGRLVTFDGKSFTVETGKDLQFIAFRN